MGRLTAAEALSHSWIRSYHRECEQTKLRKAVQKLNLANFKQFGQAEKIKKVAMMAIAVQLDPSEIRELKSIFMALARNGDGFIRITAARSTEMSFLMFSLPVTHAKTMIETSWKRPLPRSMETVTAKSTSMNSVL